MFFDTIRLLVRNENWPKANLHVTKENKSFKKKKSAGVDEACVLPRLQYRCELKCFRFPRLFGHGGLCPSFTESDWSICVY